MPNDTDVRILDAVCSFEPVSFRAPLKFGGRIVDKTFLMNVEVTVETHSGNHATGFGSMPVGNIWAWPTSELTGDQTELAMKDFAERIVDIASQVPHYGHPMELMFDLTEEYAHTAKTIVAGHNFGGELPKLLVRENRRVNLFQFSLSPGFLAALKFIAELSHLAGASRFGFIPK